LRIVYYQAPNTFWFYQAVAHYLARVLTIDVQIVQGQCDPLNDPLLLDDQVEMVIVCGLPFIRYHNQHPGQFRAIAAPVMKAPRYQQQPIYFSDIVVRKDSPFRSFADLAGSTFCYNEPGSNSGYQVMRQGLMEAGYPPDFFGNVVQSGFHQRSLRWIVDGKADCSAIDSTVLEQEFRDFPELAQHLRIVGTLGPTPMPPIIVAERLGAEQIATVQSALLHPDSDVRVAMDKANIHSFAAVSTEDYRAIAHHYDAAIQAGYAVIGKVSGFA
jgi:phosphonate transport system substrate-binding protein